MKSTSRTLPPRTAAALAAVAVTFAAATAQAEDSVGCTIQGSAVMRNNTKLYLEQAGGSPYARFTGAAVTLAASEFPNAHGGRAKVKLEGFGLEGYVDTDALPVYTTRTVAVYQGHSWIAEQRDVKIVGSGPGKVQIEKQIDYPMSQVFKAWTSCDSLTFTQTVASGWSPPGNARAYVAQDSIELFTDVDGGSVTTLFPSGVANGILMWSTESRRGWVHVMFHGDVIIDAWAKPRSLRPLPRGETMDQLYPPTVRKGKPSLKLVSEPKVVKKDSELGIRAKPSDTASIVGKIAPGTELYLLDIVAGWASVIPKSLAVAPDGDAQFWVFAADLGL